MAPHPKKLREVIKFDSQVPEMHYLSKRLNNGDENENENGDENENENGDGHLMTTLISGSESERVTAGLALAGLAVVLVVGVAVLASSSGDSSKRKTMKAPGGNYRIYRDDFEDDPSSYFRDLRKWS
ncbi:hypothetical protein PTKIN_Ptkin17bG0144400 [Pterospermum kingtungense]